jgi:hypothetical protein
MAYNKGEIAEAYASLKLIVSGLKKEVKKCGNTYTMLNNGQIKIETPQGTLVTTREQCDTILNEIKKGRTYFFVGKTNESIKSDCDVSDDGKTFIKSSIKSFIGDDPTVLNVSQATRIAYCFGDDNFNNSLVGSINRTKNISEKFDKIFRDHGVTYGSYYNQTFRDNLEAIDPGLPGIVMKTLVKRYTVGTRQLKNLVIGQDIEKFKSLLIHTITGMMPTVPYQMHNTAAGWLIVIVKDRSKWDLEVVDINNKAFRDKLFNAAYIETPSTSRHKFAYIYKDKQTCEWFLDLCLQIRLSSKLI